MSRRMSWLWGADNSAANYEKALAKLSGQISTASASLDKSRSRSRRAKALWTLYTSVTYLIAVLILVLVIGPQNWHLPHYGGVGAGPILIFGGRKAITATFGWAITRQQTHVSKLQKQREVKIAELKKATKYDSTQELPQKYGGAPPPSSPTNQIISSKKSNAKEQDSRPQQQVQRTGLPPPPTANIPGRAAIQPIRPPSRASTLAPQAPQTPQNLVQSPTTTDEPGFAPNAFTQHQPASSGHEFERHWYDRIFDLVLGEDEALAKNRLVLICQSCRLVNGQAPPGVRTLEELGTWRCQSCASLNGSQAEAAQVIREATLKHPSTPVPQSVREADDESPDHETHHIEEREGTSARDEDANDITISKRVTRSTRKAPSENL